MEEVNDPAFRMICKKAGAALTCTPLYSPLSPVPIILEDKPILQIFGPKELLQASSLELLADFMNRYDSKVSGWDFNLGCPATNAKQRSFGAYLTDVKAVEEIIKFMRSKTKKHLSMKIRKSPLSDDFLKIAEKYCDAISIHPRTREQGYSGEPDIKWAKAFKKKTKIPVIYSGNVDEINYKEFLKTFDYVMIGRKAIGHPEIFYHIVNSQTSTVNRQRPVGLGFKDYLILAEKYNVPWRIIKFQAMQFTKGDRGSRRKREKLIRVKDIEELKEIFFK
ncbi:MAG: tRNA-dihydrouridine synthase family protein [Nanoarchaeota archaeon]|nr:tRNA-dihydrouridine synthase family protein [Nanoarchaeota archaeon]